MVSRVLLVLFTVVFASQLGHSIIAPLLPLYAESMGATGVLIGLMLAVTAMSQFVVMPIVGRYSDEHGRRRFIIVGLAAFTVLSLGYVLVDSPESLIAIRLAHGIAGAFMIPVAMAYVGDLTPKGKEGSYMGLFHIFLFLGVGFGPLLGGVVAEAYGMDIAFITMGALALANLVIVILALPESTATREATKRVPYRKILANRVVQALFTYRMVNAFGMGVVMAFLPIYAVSELGLSISMVGLVISVRMLTLSALQGPCGILADRFNRVTMVLVGGTIFAVSLMAMPFARDMVQLLAINAIGAVGTSLSIAATSAITTNIGREMGMGTLMGLVSAAMSLGMSIGPLFGGLIFDTLGMHELFYIGGACACVGLASFGILIRNERVGPEHKKNKTGRTN